VDDDGSMVWRVPFPFRDGSFPPELGAVIQRSVLEGREPARVVIHTEENDWAVGDGVGDPNLPGQSVVAHLQHAIERNPSVAALASLPEGHVATRGDPDEPWSISRHEWPDDEQ
jgi:hypothetical protein